MTLITGGGEYDLCVVGMGLGGAAAMSDRLKLLVLVRTFSKRLTDLTMSLSLPKVETTLILEGAGGSVGVVDVELDRRSNDLSDLSTFSVIFY